MSFTWQSAENPAWMNFSDGERAALTAYRSRNDPMVKPKTHNMVLCWYGASMHLPVLLWRYERIVSGLCRLNPRYTPNWDSTIAADVWFTLSKSAEGATAVCGEDKLVLHNEPMRGADASARGMMNALLDRHLDDWQCAWLASRDRGGEALCMVVTPGLEEEIECSFREFVPMNDIKLPLEDLAVVIEGSNPSMCRYEEAGKPLDTVRYEPWTLPHAELMSALEQIETIWVEKPLSRRKLAAARKEIKVAQASA